MHAPAEKLIARSGIRPKRDANVCRAQLRDDPLQLFKSLSCASHGVWSTRGHRITKPFELGSRDYGAQERIVEPCWPSGLDAAVTPSHETGEEELRSRLQ